MTAMTTEVPRTADSPTALRRKMQSLSYAELTDDSNSDFEDEGMHSDVALGIEKKYDAKSMDSDGLHSRPKRLAVDYSPAAFAPILMMEGKRIVKIKDKNTKKRRSRSVRLEDDKQNKDGGKQRAGRDTHKLEGPVEALLKPTNTVLKDKSELTKFKEVDEMKSSSIKKTIMTNRVSISEYEPEVLSSTRKADLDRQDFSGLNNSEPLFSTKSKKIKLANQTRTVANELPVKSKNRDRQSVERRNTHVASPEKIRSGRQTKEAVSGNAVKEHSKGKILDKKRLAVIRYNNFSVMQIMSTPKRGRPYVPKGNKKRSESVVNNSKTTPESKLNSKESKLQFKRKSTKSRKLHNRESRDNSPKGFKQKHSNGHSTATNQKSLKKSKAEKNSKTAKTIIAKSVAVDKVAEIPDTGMKFSRYSDKNIFDSYSEHFQDFKWAEETPHSLPEETPHSPAGEKLCGEGEPNLTKNSTLALSLSSSPATGMQTEVAEGEGVAEKDDVVDCDRDITRIAGNEVDEDYLGACDILVSPFECLAASPPTFECLAASPPTCVVQDHNTAEYCPVPTQQLAERSDLNQNVTALFQLNEFYQATSERHSERERVTNVTASRSAKEEESVLNLSSGSRMNDSVERERAVRHL